MVFPQSLKRIDPRLHGLSEPICQVRSVLRFVQPCFAHRGLHGSFLFGCYVSTVSFER